MKRFPVLQILSEGLDSVWTNRMALFVALVPISVILLLFSYVSSHLAPRQGDSDFGRWILLSFGLFLLRVPLYTVFAVTVHRLVLIGNGAVPWYGQLFFSYREWKFFAYLAVAWQAYYLVLTILMNLLIMAIDIPFGPSPVFIYWIMYAAKLLVAYPLARVSLSFPAIAVDYFFGLKNTWRLSKGNSLRLYLCVTIVPSLFWFLMHYLPGASNVLVRAFYSFVTYVMFAVEIAILSVSYKWLVHADDLSPSHAKTNDHNWPVIGKTTKRLLSLLFISLALILLAGMLYKRFQIPHYHSIKSVEVALRSDDWNDVLTAIDALQDFPRQKAVPLLNRLWKNPNDFNLGPREQLRARIEIASVLLFFSKKNPSELERFIFKESSNSDPQVKDSAILALVHVNNDNAVNALRAIIVDDPQSQSAEWAIISLRTMAGSYPTDYPLEVMEDMEKMQQVRKSNAYSQLVKAIAEVKEERGFP